MSTSILVVDDDPSVCFTVREVLASGGLSCQVVHSGQECLAALREGFAGLILLDIMMPNMDGWQTLAAMRREGLLEGNLVCMLTAVANPGEEMEDLKECVLEYVRKPFSAEGLIETVRNYLEYLTPAC